MSHHSKLTRRRGTYMNVLQTEPTLFFVVILEGSRGDRYLNQLPQQKFMGLRAYRGPRDLRSTKGFRSPFIEEAS